MLSLLKRSVKAVQPFIKRTSLATKYSFSESQKPINSAQQSSNLNVLSHKLDHYRSVTIDPKSLPDDVSQFEKMLEGSINHFREVISTHIIIILFSVKIQRSLVTVRP